MIKKNIINIIKIILIFLPVIVFGVDFCATFWGTMYELNVNQTNVATIKEVLQKDNIKIENINNVTKIKISGAGLNDYYILSFYNNDTRIECTHLYLNKTYYIKQYLTKHHKFNYTDMVYISIFISALTIGVTIYTSRKKEIKIEK